MSNSKILGAVVSMLLVTGTVSAEPLIVDSFESGDMSATNEDGFDWQRNNRTSVVTRDAAVYNNGDIYNTPKSGQDWSAFHGEHSLRFRYPAGEAMTEQRFRLGGSYRDIWFQYWVRVPENYYHGQSNPSNHKFFALWMDEYSNKGYGATVIWEFWGSSGGASNIVFHYNEGGRGSGTAHQQYTSFVSPNDRGKWMEITIHVAASSSSNSNDGVIEMWRRWESESPDQRELLHRKTDAKLPVPSGGPQGWSAGYFMGWANAAYSNDTEWLIDLVAISTESLLGSGDLADETGNPPNPPKLEINR